MSVECPTEQQLERLAAGAIDRSEAETLRAHLDACASCRASLEEWKANIRFVARFGDALPKIAETSPSIRGRARAGSVRSGGAGSGTGSRIRLPEIGSDLPRVDAIPGYSMIREIHRGGQGVVYEAIQRSTRRTVALKVLLEGPFAGERARWRFEREVRLIASLKHPNIVVIHDSGETDGRHYFAMDYIQGRPLDEYVRVNKLPVSQIVPLFHQVCEAVNYAHRRGVMHRDLKPSNILVNDDGLPYVLDFGLAKLTGEEAFESHDGLVSVAGHLMGTLRYMSPEQTVGKPDEIDIRTDVYSLGVILYELLTDSAPYETARADLTVAIRNIREADPPRLTKKCRHVGSELEAIVMKAMEKDPQRRYQSAGELSQDLQAWIDGRPVTAKSASSLYMIRKLAFRNWYHTLVAACLVIIVVSFGATQAQAIFKNIQLNRRLAQSDAAVVTLNQLRDKAGQGAEAIQQNAFGWFLMEWHAGHLDQARKIPFRPGSPESLAAAFLLDDAFPPERLMERMPETTKELAHFVLGERLARANRKAEAIKAFRLAVETARRKRPDPEKSPGLILSFAKARLEQLGDRPTASSPQTEPPNPKGGT